MRVKRRWYGLGVAMVLAAAASVRAQVLDYVPANAPFIFKVNNLKATSDKIAAMATKWGISAMSPMLSNPLASLKQEANITNGLNDAGDMAFVVTKIPHDEKEAEAEKNGPPMLILAPVSDYKAFVGNFQGAKAEGEITEIQFPNDSQPSYVAHWGDYAAISNDKTTLAAKPAGVKEGGAVAKQLSGKDIVLLVNMTAVRDEALPKIQQHRQEWIDKMADKLNAKPETQKYVPLAKAVANRALDVVESFVSNCQAATWGWSFSPDGMGATLLAQFKPESTWAKNIDARKQSEQPLVHGLPIGKYLLYGGWIGDRELAGSVIDSLVGPLKDELAKLGEQGAIAQKLIDAVEKDLKNIDSQSFGLLAPANAAQGSLLQAVSVTRGNASAIMEASTDLAHGQAELIQKVNTTSPTSMTVTPDAKTVDGVHFLSIKSTVSAQADSPEAAGARQFMNFVYGSDSAEQYLGQINDSHVLAVNGLSDAQITQAIGAAKADEAHLTAAKPVETVSKLLPAKRFFELFIPVDNIITSAAEVAKDRAGMPINLQIQPDLQPIGITGAMEENAVRFDGYLPAELVQNLISSGMQAMGQMSQPHQEQQQPQQQPQQ